MEQTPARKKSLRLAIIGYGKMGKAIEEVAVRLGHTIVLKINSGNTDKLTVAHLQSCDVAIEFTGPDSAVKNIMLCIDAAVPVVTGSTGWLERWDEVKEYSEKKHAALLYASNFSIGVNIFFEVNRKLAELMSLRRDYDVTIEEIHHTQKKDAPSGTAITLAENIINLLPYKTAWLKEPGKEPGKLSITSKRIDPAPGTHKVKYSSAVDDIEIIHTAHNREGFAAGAVMAAEFLADKKAVYTMRDVLNIK